MNTSRLFCLVFASLLSLSDVAAAPEKPNAASSAGAQSSAAAPQQKQPLSGAQQAPASSVEKAMEPNEIAFKMCFKNSTCSGKPWRKLDAHNCKNAGGTSWKANRTAVCQRHL